MTVERLLSTNAQHSIQMKIDLKCRKVGLFFFIFINQTLRLIPYTREEKEMSTTDMKMNDAGKELMKSLFGKNDAQPMKREKTEKFTAFVLLIYMILHHALLFSR